MLIFRKNDIVCKSISYYNDDCSIYKEHMVTVVTIHEEMLLLGNKYIYTLYYKNIITLIIL
jgi:hypothetical protein